MSGTDSVLLIPFRDGRLHESFRSGFWSKLPSKEPQGIFHCKESFLYLFDSPPCGGIALAMRFQARQLISQFAPAGRRALMETIFTLERALVLQIGGTTYAFSFWPLRSSEGS